MYEQQKQRAASAAATAVTPASLSAAGPSSSTAAHAASSRQPDKGTEQAALQDPALHDTLHMSELADLEDDMADHPDDQADAGEADDDDEHFEDEADLVDDADAAEVLEGLLHELQEHGEYLDDDDDDDNDDMGQEEDQDDDYDDYEQGDHDDEEDGSDASDDDVYDMVSYLTRGMQQQTGEGSGRLDGDDDDEGGLQHAQQGRQRHRGGWTADVSNGHGAHNHDDDDADSNDDGSSVGMDLALQFAEELLIEGKHPDDGDLQDKGNGQAGVSSPASRVVTNSPSGPDGARTRSKAVAGRAAEGQRDHHHHQQRQHMQHVLSDGPWKARASLRLEKMGITDTEVGGMGICD